MLLTTRSNSSSGDTFAVAYHSPLLEGIRNSLDATNEEARFLLLHIDLDKDHANVMRDIVLDYCKSKADRRELFRTTKMILDARACFYDRLLQYFSADGRSATSEIYDKQSNGWKRDGPTCLSDFTGRPGKAQANALLMKSMR